MNLQILSPCPYIYLPSGILIIEPNEGLRVARGMLLSAAGQRIDISKSKVFEPQLSGECEVTFAILSESLGYALLSETALAIRKTWPHARILILGKSGAAMEDHLYDARIDQRARPEDLLAALFMLAEYPQNQRATPHAVPPDGRVRRVLDGAPLGGNKESDPTKRFANNVPTTYSRDMPGEEQQFRKAS